MHTPRSIAARTSVALTALAFVTAGCGQIAERATEEAVERALESDTGEEVDIDVSDGEISIESDEGNLTINADGDGVEIDGTDAEGNDFTLTADEDGLEATSDERGSLEVDTDANFTATDEHGASVFDTGEGIPEDWPSDVPRPDGLDEVHGIHAVDDGQERFVVTGSADGSALEVFDDYAGRLADAGYEETSSADQGVQFRTAAFAKGETTVAVTTQSTGDTAELIVLVD